MSFFRKKGRKKGAYTINDGPSDCGITTLKVNFFSDDDETPAYKNVDFRSFRAEEPKEDHFSGSYNVTTTDSDSCSSGSVDNTVLRRNRHSAPVQSGAVDLSDVIAGWSPEAEDSGKDAANLGKRRAPAPPRRQSSLSPLAEQNGVMLVSANYRSQGLQGGSNPSIVDYEASPRKMGHFGDEYTSQESTGPADPSTPSSPDSQDPRRPAQAPGSLKRKLPQRPTSAPPPKPTPVHPLIGKTSPQATQPPQPESPAGTQPQSDTSRPPMEVVKQSQAPLRTKSPAVAKTQANTRAQSPSPPPAARKKQPPRPLSTPPVRSASPANIPVRSKSPGPASTTSPVPPSRGKGSGTPARAKSPAPVPPARPTSLLQTSHPRNRPQSAHGVRSTPTRQETAKPESPKLSSERSQTVETSKAQKLSLGRPKPTVEPSKTPKHPPERPKHTVDSSKAAKLAVGRPKSAIESYQSPKENSDRPKSVVESSNSPKLTPGRPQSMVETSKSARPAVPEKPRILKDSANSVHGMAKMSVKSESDHRSFRDVMKQNLGQKAQPTRPPAPTLAPPISKPDTVKVTGTLDMAAVLASTKSPSKPENGASKDRHVAGQAQTDNVVPALAADIKSPEIQTKSDAVGTNAGLYDNQPPVQTSNKTPEQQKEEFLSWVLENSPASKTPAFSTFRADDTSVMTGLATTTMATTTMATDAMPAAKGKPAMKPATGKMSAKPPEIEQNNNVFGFIEGFDIPPPSFGRDWGTTKNSETLKLNTVPPGDYDSDSSSIDDAPSVRAASSNYPESDSSSMIQTSTFTTAHSSGYLESDSSMDQAPKSAPSSGYVESDTSSISGPTPPPRKARARPKHTKQAMYDVVEGVLKSPSGFSVSSDISDTSSGTTLTSNAGTISPVPDSLLDDDSHEHGAVTTVRVTSLPDNMSDRYAKNWAQIPTAEDEGEGLDDWGEDDGMEPEIMEHKDIRVSTAKPVTRDVPMATRSQAIATRQVSGKARFDSGISSVTEVEYPRDEEVEPKSSGISGYHGNRGISPVAEQTESQEEEEAETSLVDDFMASVLQGMPPPIFPDQNTDSDEVDSVKDDLMVSTQLEPLPEEEEEEVPPASPVDTRAPGGTKALEGVEEVSPPSSRPTLLKTPTPEGVRANSPLPPPLPSTSPPPLDTAPSHLQHLDNGLGTTNRDHKATTYTAQEAVIMPATDSPMKASLPGPQSSLNTMILLQEDYTHPDIQNNILLPEEYTTSNNLHSEANMAFRSHQNSNRTSEESGVVSMETPRASANHNQAISNLININSDQVAPPREYGRQFDRQESLRSTLSSVSESTIAEEPSPWQQKRPSEWDNDDIIEWCQSQGFDELAELLQDCGIEGQDFLHITSQDFDDLGVDPELRRRVLDEIKLLQNLEKSHKSGKAWNDKVPLVEWSCDDVSRWLESVNLREFITPFREHNVSGKDLSEINMQLLDCGIEGQDFLHITSQDFDDLGVDPELRRRVLDEIKLLQNLEKSHKSGNAWNDKVPLVEWSCDDVSRWLESVNLREFITPFREHNVSGKDLSEINMQLLDDVQMTSTEDRELILSKLYELQHPEGPSLDHLTRSPRQHSHEPQRPSAPPSNKVKPHEVNVGMATVAGQENLPVKHSNIQKGIVENIVPVATLSSHAGKGNDHGFYGNKLTNREAEDHKTVGKKLMFKGESKKVTIWHDFAGKFGSSCVSVTPGQTCAELVRHLLEHKQITEDPNLYYLQQVSLDPRYTGHNRELSAEDSPLTPHTWPSGSSYRTELRQYKGLRLKVLCQDPDGSPRGKTITIAKHTPVSAIITLARKQLHLEGIPDTKLGLLEMEPDGGDAHFLPPDTVAGELDKDTLLLCSRDQFRKERSRPATSSKTSSAPLVEQLKQELLTMRDEISDRDQLIRQLHKEKQDLEVKGVRTSDLEHALQVKDHQVIDLQRSLNDLQAGFKDKESHWQQNFQKLQKDIDRLKLIDSLNADPEGKVSHLQMELVALTERVHGQEKHVQHTESQLENAKNKRDQSAAERLQAALRNQQSDLKSLKQSHADVYAQMETAKNQLKKAQNPLGFSLFEAFGSLVDPQSVLCLEVTQGSFNFVPGRDKDGHLFVKFVDEDQELKKGDRIVEIDGQMTYKMDDKKVTSILLNDGQTNLRLVVLRRTPVGPSTEQVDEIKRELSQAVTELRTLQLDNKELNQHITKLQLTNRNLLHTKVSFQGQIDDLKGQLAESEGQWGELRGLLSHVATRGGGAKHKQGGATDRVGGAKGGANDSVQPPQHRPLEETEGTFTFTEGRSAPDAGDQSREGVEGRGFLRSLVNGQGGDQVTAYQEMDDSAPLWEHLKTASKEAILSALREHIQETSQQKVYLDHLITVVVETAPHLLEHVDNRAGLNSQEDMTIKERSEEFC